ncbi:MAG: cytosine deaminase [Nocardioides sp.]|nr:cytosine deaminase [Nocardioides sp.]
MTDALPLLRIRNATLLPVDDSGEDVLHDAWLEVGADGRVAAIGTGTPPSGRVVEDLDVAGALVAPGFVSSHSHLFTSGSRGLGSDCTLYGWADAMYARTREATPEEIYWCVLHGSLDYLDNGVTTAFDFADPLLRWEPMVDGKRSEVGHLRPIEYAYRQVDAKVDAGLRFVHAIQLDESVGTDEEILERLGAGVAHARTAPADQLLRASVSGGVQWARRRDAADLEAEAMERFRLMNQAHFLETPEAVEHQRSRFAWLREAGLLGSDFVFGHFVQTTPEILDEAAANGCAVSWQPAANGRLGSGVADVVGMRERGMRVGIGLDDQACSDLADPWQSMRLGLYTLRATGTPPSSLLPRDLLRIHTRGAAEALGVDDRVGSLEVGKQADLVVVDPRHPDVGPLWDPVASYVLSMSLRNLRRVVVGGRTVSVDGVSTNPVADEARAKLHEVMHAIAVRS